MEFKRGMKGHAVAAVRTMHGSRTRPNANKFQAQEVSNSVSGAGQPRSARNTPKEALPLRSHAHCTVENWSSTRIRDSYI